MGYNFAGGGDDSDQVFLLPPDPREWLPRRHLAWAMRTAAAELDIAPFAGWYRADGQGHRAFHPRLMVALIMYCYCKGIRSSRAIEMATYDDVGARVICENLNPDHSTIHRFVSRHEAAVKGLLVASLVACARQGLVSVDVVAGDGTKLKANASMAANATAEQLEIEIAGLEALIAAEVETWVAQARAADAAEDALFGDGDDGGDAGVRAGGPGTLARVTGKVVRRQKAKARLDGEAAGRRKRPDGRAPAAAADHCHVRRARQAAERAEHALAKAAAAPVPDGQDPAAKANTTDPSSRVMPAKGGGFGQLHNVQILAGKHQIIVGIGTHDNPTDTAALHPLLDKARANLDAAGIGDRIAAALFDAGYASNTNFTTPCE